MSEISPVLMARIGRVVDPLAAWDNPPINEYDAARLERAQDKVREILATVSFANGDLIPADVRRLVIASRHVAFDHRLDDDARRELDAASEAFADRIPWEDEPEETEATRT